MNHSLEELKSRASRLSPDAELEMYAPLPQYMSMLESAIKEKHELSVTQNGFMMKLSGVPVFVRSTTVDFASVMEGRADTLRFTTDVGCES